MLPDGRKLITLTHAADYIMKLPKLIMAAEGRGPTMHALAMYSPVRGAS